MSDLENMTKKELVEMAKSRDIKITTSAKKSDILKMIQDAQDAIDDLEAVMDQAEDMIEESNELGQCKWWALAGASIVGAIIGAAVVGVIFFFDILTKH